MTMELSMKCYSKTSIWARVRSKHHLFMQIYNAVVVTGTPLQFTKVSAKDVQDTQPVVKTPHLELAPLPQTLPLQATEQ